MKKFIAAILFLLTITSYATAYGIYNTAGENWIKEPTYRGYIIFESESEYNKNKAAMAESHIYITDREIEYTESKSQELNYILVKNNVKPGAYIVEFIVEEVPGNGQDWYAQVNYKYVK